MLLLLQMFRASNTEGVMLTHAFLQVAELGAAVKLPLKKRALQSLPVSKANTQRQAQVLSTYPCRTTIYNMNAVHLRPCFLGKND